MTGLRPIPKDTNDALSPEALANCRNLGLLLDRLNPWERYEKRAQVLWDLTAYVWDRKEERHFPRRGGEAKGRWLDELARQSHVDTSLLDAYRARWEQLAAHYGADAKSGLRFDLRTQARLVVGLGTDSVLETAITLHRIYGFPTIPGSALKGLTRTWALLKLATNLGVPSLDYGQFLARKGPQIQNKRSTPLNLLEGLLEADLNAKDEKGRAIQKALDKLKSEKAVQDAGGDILNMGLPQFREDPGVCVFRAVFGYLGQAGGAVFFDAIPIEEPQFVADVMNVHYPDYYRDEKRETPPSDDQDPNPVSFFAVAEGIAFRFAVGGRRPSSSGDIACAQAARVWLKQGLCEAGIGAKTVAGYGYFGSSRPAKIERADREPPIPPVSPEKPKKESGEGPEQLSEKREKEMSSLTEDIMHSLYGDEE